MRAQKIHLYLGLGLSIPLVIWCFTGAIFLLKPGYSNAYQSLSIKTYPLNTTINIHPESDWANINIVKTIIGTHLLVKGNKTQHLNYATSEPWEKPTKQQIEMLISDTIIENKRYGKITSIENYTAYTENGIAVTLNWKDLTLRQQGDDTKLINTLYKLHYLQWTSFKAGNLILGVAGLSCLTLLTSFGLFIYLRKLRDRS